MDLENVRNSINLDKKNYLGKKYLIYKITNHQNYIYFKALKYNRLYRFYKNNHSGIINKIKYLYYIKMKNQYCNSYCLELNGSHIGDNLIIYHNNIVVNEKSKIGNNCKLHGNNCIGNNGFSNDCPQIGDNVDIGYGTVIIGNIKISDNIVIGVNSVVNKDLLESDSIYAGCPAKLIRRKNERDN